MAARKQKRTTPAEAAEAVDEQLSRYHAMRDFSMTAEPSGASTKAKSQPAALPFVVQKHAATRLHYDFRLGWHGVLKSWAVTKGPSYYTGDKRLAVQVEDHPIDYGGFEGAIPQGQYGGGTVMVWDQGTWEPHGDAEEGLRAGRLKFALHGEKLKGNWTLIRMGGHAARESKPNWLLIKEHDEFERSESDPPITDAAPNSVITGRSLEQIAAAEDHVWNSKPAARTQNRSRLTRKLLQQRSEAAPDREAALKHAPREKFPGFLKPQLAIQSTEAPTGSDWLHELKLDGYRIQVQVQAGKAALFTRNGLDWTHRMPDLAATAAQLPVQAALLDGEVVVLDSSGGTSFADLQAAFEQGANHHLTYFAFDLLHLDGHNLRALPLIERKTILEGLLSELPSQDVIRYSEHVTDNGSETFHNACKLGAEGIVSKLGSSTYSSTRSQNWRKLKCIRQQEFVIGGFTLPSDKGSGIGALLLGYYEDGKLRYAGRTGTGFTRKSRASLRKQLDALRQPKPAFAAVPKDATRDGIWVKPEMVAEVHFATWTSEGIVRQASFQGIREDKSPREVTREDAAPVPRQRKAAKHKPSAALSTAAKSVAAKSSPAKHAVSQARSRSSAKSDPAPGLRITHPDKVLDQETGLTKQQLADYYLAVAEHMLPHIAGRPLSIVRCPEGSTKPCFFQKHVGAGLPAGVDSIAVPDKKTGKPEDYITISTAEGLAGLAQMGVLEVHPWGSRNDDLEHPDRLIFDFDPDLSIDWKTLVASAKNVRELLKKLGLETFVKSTGGKGLHVVAPMQPEHTWADLKAFARGIALAMEDANPKLFLSKMTKSARKDRIYIDYLRNDRGATAVAPWSPRARTGAQVAIPLSWSELAAWNNRPCSVSAFAEWKQRLRRDPWAKMNQVRQRLDPQILRDVIAAQATRK